MTGATTRHPPMLREILDVGLEFEAHLGRELTVNPTDLAAMEHLIQNADRWHPATGPTASA